VTRAHFEAMRSPHGALLVGNPGEVAEKIAGHSEALGGISRITFQMDIAGLSHTKLLRAIDLLGARVAPMLREKAAVDA
jgi:alkanesulfonate monooxygenase SsuD/methylene tetrahydromethanopterin reductase-like flavin-dependent oxidoreductase (luciferase family)